MFLIKIKQAKKAQEPQNFIRQMIGMMVTMMANRHEEQKDFSDSRIAFSTENNQNMHT